MPLIKGTPETKMTFGVVTSGLPADWTTKLKGCLKYMKADSNYKITYFCEEDTVSTAAFSCETIDGAKWLAEMLTAMGKGKPEDRSGTHYSLGSTLREFTLRNEACDGKNSVEENQEIKVAQSQVVDRPIEFEEWESLGSGGTFGLETPGGSGVLGRPSKLDAFKAIPDDKRTVMGSLAKVTQVPGLLKLPWKPVSFVKPRKATVKSVEPKNKTKGLTRASSKVQATWICWNCGGEHPVEICFSPLCTRIVQITISTTGIPEIVYDYKVLMHTFAGPIVDDLQHKTKKNFTRRALEAVVGFFLTNKFCNECGLSGHEPGEKWNNVTACKLCDQSVAPKADERSTIIDVVEAVGALNWQKADWDDAVIKGANAFRQEILTEKWDKYGVCLKAVGPRMMLTDDWFKEFPEYENYKGACSAAHSILCDSEFPLYSDSEVD